MPWMTSDDWDDWNDWNDYHCLELTTMTRDE